MAADNRRRLQILSIGWIPVTVVLCSGLLQWGAPATVAWLRYEHRAILQGEIWRLLTGNLVHLGWTHYGMNMLALILIVSLFPVLIAPRRGLVLLTACGLAVGCGLLIFNPDVDWYVGLSGVLHGLFAAAVVFKLAEKRYIEGSLLLALLILKLLWEQLAGAVPGSAALAGGAVIVDAHLYGAIGGLVGGMWYAVGGRRQKGEEE